MILANKFTLNLFAGLAALSFAGVANADTTGGTSPTIGPFNTNFGLGTGAHPATTLTLPQFDSTLGTLTGISFTIGGNVTTIFSGQDLSGNPNNVTLKSQGTITLLAPDLSTIVFTTPINTFGPVPVAASAAFGPTSVVAAGSQTNPAYAGLFAPFEAPGGGSISLPVTAAGSSNASDDNGNITTSIQTKASAYASVVYTYNAAVPEPGNVAMLVAGGLTGAGLFVRRRSKK